MKKHFTVLLLLLLLAASFLTTDRSVNVMKNIFFTAGNTEKKQLTIVIDPGHGGRDPGKVGINNVLEKDINLSIALKLKNLLEHNDINVVMTREEDIGLYSESDSNKKRADMNHRIELIHSNHADLAVSIHQNSFPQEYVRGAQVFYYTKSEQGKKLAEIIQEQIKKSMDDGNHRQAKANDNYFMLTKTECPLVIVECGYLTNSAEAALLLNEDYQEKMAWAIHLGVLQYVSSGMQ